MKKRLLATLICTVLLLSAVPIHASALSVTVAGSPLKVSATAPFAVNGVTYVALADFCPAMGACSVTWSNGAATVTASGLSLTAAPGACYLTANGRCLYASGGIRVVGGRTMVPLRLLAQVYGASIGWNGQSRTASVTGGGTFLTSGNRYYDADSVYWLSCIISAESTGEPMLGQIAVGNVILNRVKSDLFPNTIYTVIFDDAYAIQFEPVANGTIYNTPVASAVAAAKLCLEGANVAGDCLYFRNPGRSTSAWIAANRTYAMTIGSHVFYE